MLDSGPLTAAQAAIEGGESLFMVADRLQWAPQRLWRALRRQDHFEEVARQCALRRTKKSQRNARPNSSVRADRAVTLTATEAATVIGLRCKRVRLPAIRIMLHWTKRRRPRKAGETWN